MSQNTTHIQGCDQPRVISPDNEVTQELIYGTIEFRSNSLRAIIAELSAAVESGALDHLEEAFVVRITGRQLSPAHQRWYSSKP